MQCTAKRRDGKPCGNHAVQGAKVCRMHGASSPQAKAKAAQRVAEQKAAKSMRLFASPVEVDPGQALLDLVHWTAGEVEYWREQVRALADEDPNALTWGVVREKVGGEDYGTTLEAKPNVAYTMLYAAQDRLEKYATAALRAGVAERQIKLAEKHGHLLAQVIRGIYADLDLTPDQQARSGEIAARHLRLVSGAA